MLITYSRRPIWSEHPPQLIRSLLPKSGGTAILYYWRSAPKWEYHLSAGKRSNITNPLTKCPEKRARSDGQMYFFSTRNNFKQIVILNPKGGCGKTTLATNLASYFALRGSRPMLIDNDPNGYTSRWLQKRPKDSCRIHGITDGRLELHDIRNWQSHIPKGIEKVIIDTPAALGRREIAKVTYNADCILVPVLPSAFDIHYSTKFIADLLLLTQFERPVAVVANRTRQNTKSLAMLMRVLESFETPTIAVLRNSQNYVHAANQGLGIYEMPYNRVRKDLGQMDRVVGWLDQLLTTKLQPEPTSLFNFQPRPVAASGGGSDVASRG